MMQSSKERLALKRMTLYAVLTAVICILGVVSIPMPTGLNITFNMIPVAVAAVAAGYEGGVVMGTVFGLVSFLQCFGILGSSALGAACVSAAPVLTFIQRVVSRMLMGFLTAVVFQALRKVLNEKIRFSVAGFLAAFLNTLFFMGLLVLLLSEVPDVQKAVAGRSFLVYVVASVGVNGLVEMAVSSLLTTAICMALKKANLIYLDSSISKVS